MSDEKKQSDYGKLMNSIQLLKSHSEAIAEYYFMESKLLKERFDNLIKSGFDKDQALQIIIHRGIFT